jgi:MFS family permease
LEKRAILVSIIAISICAITLGLLGPTTVILLERNQSPTWIIGSVTSIGYICIFLFSPLASKLIDRYGIKKIMSIGFIIAIIGTCGYFFWRNYYILFIGRALWGVGITLSFVATEILINYCSNDSNRGFNMNLYVIAFQVGMGIGTFLVWMVEIYELLPGITGLFITIIAFIIQTIFFMKINIELPRRTKEEKFSFKYMPLIAVAAALLYGYLESSSSVIIPLYSLRNNFSHNDVYYSVSSFVSGGIIILFLIGKLSDKISKYKLLLIITIMLSVLYIILICINTSISNIIVFFIIGGLIPAFYSIGLTYVAEKIDMKFISQANGYFAMLFGLGTLLGPSLGSFFIEYNQRYAGWAFSVLLCLSFILIFYKRRKQTI